VVGSDSRNDGPLLEEPETPKIEHHSFCKFGQSNSTLECEVFHSGFAFVTEFDENGSDESEQGCFVGEQCADSGRAALMDRFTVCFRQACKNAGFRRFRWEQAFSGAVRWLACSSPDAVAGSGSKDVEHAVGGFESIAEIQVT
jgi:hypothetical protein